MSKTQKPATESNLMLLGGLVTLVGLLVLATTNQWLGLSARNSWPIYLLFPGLLILISGLRIKNMISRGLLVFFGSELSLLGIFFFAFTFGVFHWSAMRSLWPVFILIPGLALLAAYYASHKKSEILLAPGAALSIGALSAILLLQLGGSLLNASSVWPILIIVVGVVLVVASLLKKSSR